jgi:hypothetical protein
MERSEIRESMRPAPTAPDSASLHPGYDAVIASGAKQSIVTAGLPWIASLRTQ